jgi:hypothetical protein
MTQKMKLIYVKIDDPCCPNTADVTVSEFTKGSLNMIDCVDAQRRIAHFYFVPADTPSSAYEHMESWKKAPAHLHAEPPYDIPGLVQLDVLLQDLVEEIARMAQPGEPPVEVAKTKKVKTKKRRR